MWLVFLCTVWDRGLVWISGVSVCACKGSKRNQRLWKCSGIVAEQSCTSHTHRAKGFQEPTDGWMSCLQFETTLSWTLNVLKGFESFSGWLTWTLRSRSLSAVVMQGITRGGRRTRCLSSPTAPAAEEPQQSYCHTCFWRLEFQA